MHQMADNLKAAEERNAIITEAGLLKLKENHPLNKVSQKRLQAVARASLDRLGDCCNGEDFEELLDNVYVLAHDAIVDAGGSRADAMRIALALVAEHRG
jgi:hypothetical protein